MPLDYQPATKTLKPFDTANLIVFTDLDGTLLDHETYSYAPANEALSLLRDKRVPLVLASSKTAAEMHPLRKALGFDHCEAIVENGAGVLEPGAIDEQTSTDYEQILALLAQIPDGLRCLFKGFSDWSAADVADQTGLSVENAELAKKRLFSEPGLWSGDAQQLSAFRSHLTEWGIVAQQGGRFLSLSFGGNKAEKMLEIQKRYDTANSSAFSIALGDAENDIAMLEAADFGVIIPNPTHKGIPRLGREASGQIIRAGAPGPEGWNDTLKTILATKEQAGD